MELDLILRDIHRVDPRGVRQSLCRVLNPHPIFSKYDKYFYKDRSIKLEEVYAFCLLSYYPYERVNRRFVKTRHHPIPNKRRQWVSAYTLEDSKVQFSFIRRKGEYQKNLAIVNTVKKFYPKLKPVKFIVPGDGIIPKTGLFLAHYFPDSIVHSFDPQRREFNYLLGPKDLDTYNTIQRYENLNSLACTWENFLGCNVSRFFFYPLIMTHIKMYLFYG